MVLELSVIFYLISALQALILIAVILKNKARNIGEWIMVLLLLGLSVTLTHYALLIHGHMNYQMPFADISAISWFSIAPLLHLYTLSALGKIRRLKWIHLLFFPFSLYLTVTSFLSLAGIQVGFYHLFDDMNSYTIFWIGAYLLNSMVFCGASVREIDRAELQPKHSARIRWLRTYFILFGVLTTALLCFLVWSYNAEFFYYELEFLLLASFSLFVFILVFKSLSFSTYLSKVAYEDYGAEKLGQKELLDSKERLIDYIDKQAAFMDPELSLADLSAGTGLSENSISQVFGRAMDSNFYRYINQKRLIEFKKRLEQEGTSKKTIIGLAQESGFKSKASFYRVFKEHTGMTPSEYLKALKN